MNSPHLVSRFGWPGVIEHYREFLPVSDRTPVVTLLEGNTPLIPAPRIARRLGEQVELFLKHEGLNPTSSFKDRGMTVAVSKALEEGATAVMCASTGNTSASAAAYASRAGIRAIVVIPEGAIALGKLAQATITGAAVIAVRGNFDAALSIVREITRKYPIALVNSLNPYRLEGQQTAAFEICDCLGAAPDFQAIPVGNAGNITAYWMGYQRYAACGKINRCPVMLGFQAAGAAPIVRGHPIENPETVATAIRIGNPASWKKAEQARDESGGLIDMVSDREILEAYKLIAQEEGIFVEPASPASLAGLLKLKAQGYFDRPELRRPLRIVAILTGHGLKDPERAIAESERPPVVEATTAAVLQRIGY